MQQKKLLYIIPHCSTGGQPQYTLKQVEKNRLDFDITVIELNYYGDQYVVQRNKLIGLLGSKFISLNVNNKPSAINELMWLIDRIKPDVVHLQEVPEHDEMFIRFPRIADQLFSPSRLYKIIATTHGSNTDPFNIKWQADHYSLVSEWSKNRFAEMFPSDMLSVEEYPIVDLKPTPEEKSEAQKELGWCSKCFNVLNVGLFTPGKNQKEIIADVSPYFRGTNTWFHFVGNQAENFKNYWKPLMDVESPNCVIHGERSDVEKFYKAADCFYFPSTLELNPLSVKEALSYGLPVIMHRLATYLDQYDQNPLVYFYTTPEQAIQLIQFLRAGAVKITPRDMHDAPPLSRITHDEYPKWSQPREEDSQFDQARRNPLTERDCLSIPANEFDEEVKQVENEILGNGIYERYFDIEPGDVVVDVGAHVGVFSQLALHKGAGAVYAFEPDPLFISQLKQITNPRFFYEQVAIANSNGITTIKSDGHANAIGSGDTEVRCRTFETLLQRYKLAKIDFLKVDCEGGEYDLFTTETIKHLAVQGTKITGEFHIHNSKHKMELIRVLMSFDSFNVPIQITDIDGNEISREQLIDGLNYYTEILFYATSRPEGLKRKGAVIGLNSSGTQEETVSHHFVNGARIEINGSRVDEYDVKFFNNETGDILHQATIGNNSWASCAFQYYVPYRIHAVRKSDGKEIADITMNLEGKKVYIELSSSALGDSIAWMPYVEEFRKKHNCDVTVMTFHNNLFKDVYPDINFNAPGETYTCYAAYTIGWFYKEEDLNATDLHRNPRDPKGVPLQQTATDILGLEYEEIVPNIVRHGDIVPPLVSKYVCIANHGTSQAKYWNNRVGWQKLVDHLLARGIVVVLLSKEKDGHNGNDNPRGVQYPRDYKLETIQHYLHHCEFFVGIGSGLSWLAWAMRKPVVLISGFSLPFTEMKSNTLRISSPEGVCTGCFNWRRLQDSGTWTWCPHFEGDKKREFECTKTITADTVIEKIEEKFFSVPD